MYNAFEQLLADKENAIKQQTPKIRTCPICKNGKMLVIKELPRILSLVRHLPSILLSLLN